MVNKIATIDVAYVNDPKPGKKMGNIKTPDGTTYFGYPNVLAGFHQGMKCTISYREDPPKEDGSIFRTVTGITDQPPANGNATPTGVRKATGGQNGSYVRPETPTQEKEQMFVCKLLGDFIQAKAVGLAAEELVDSINLLRDAYRLTFGNKQQAADMNGDSIPY